MPNSKTIKDIKQIAVGGIILQAEHTTNDIKFISAELETALLSLLDKVDKKTEEIEPSYEGEALDTNNNRRWYEQGFGEFKKEVKKILSDIREDKK